MGRSESQRIEIAHRLSEIAYEALTEAYRAVEDLDDDEDLFSALCMAIIIKLGSFIAQGIIKEDVPDLTRDCIDLFKQSVAQELKNLDRTDLN